MFFTSLPHLGLRLTELNLQELALSCGSQGPPPLSGLHPRYVVTGQFKNLKLSDNTLFRLNAEQSHMPLPVSDPSVRRQIQLNLTKHEHFSFIHTFTNFEC